jgi:hypothetical protein
MADQPRPQDRLKQSSSIKKTSGAKDLRSLKSNKNRSLEAPPMPDISKEQAVAERLGSRGHGSHPPKVIAKVLRLAERGYSITQMCADAKNGKGLPHPWTLYRWRSEEPDFKEAFDERYRAYVDDQARQMLPMASGWGRESEQLLELRAEAKRMARVKGLKGAEKVAAIDKMIARTVDLSTALLNAQDKRVHRTLQIAARQLPAEWGEHTEGETDMIVLDVGLGGPIKTLGLPGEPDGQNVQARLAMKREKR